MARDSLDASTLVVVLQGVCDAMGDSIGDLTHADQAIGDGDHGLAIQRGVRAATSALQSMPPVTTSGRSWPRSGWRC